MNALRQLLIARGAIVPFVARPKPIVLRLDDRGKRMAARHIEEYWADPWMWNSRPFWNPEPEDFFDTKEFATQEMSS